MRLPIALTASFLLSLGLNAPVMSQPPLEVAQPSVSTSANLVKLRANQRLWNRKKIDSYRYTFSNGCFCIPEARGPVKITVDNGLTTSITSVETGEPVNPQFFQQYNTIPKLFKVIRDAIADNAYRVNVKYDPKFGYPTQINIDYDALIADEEIYLTIENFEVLTNKPHKHKL